MNVSNLVKIGFVVGVMGVMTGCASSPDKVYNYSKPQQPVFGKKSPDTYKQQLTTVNPQVTVSSSRLTPSPVALHGGSVKVDLVVSDVVVKTQPDLNVDLIKSASEKMLTNKGVSVVNDNADYDATLYVLAHGKKSVVQSQLSSTDTGNLAGMIGSTGAYNGMTSSGLVGVGLVFGALQALSGGESENYVTVMKMIVKNNKTNETWENVFEHFQQTTSKINQEMLSNLIREQLEPLDPEYAAVLTK